jgi:hypothetical protein
MRRGARNPRGERAGEAAEVEAVRANHARPADHAGGADPAGTIRLETHLLPTDACLISVDDVQEV